jgi:hypothetical protein
MQDTIDIEQTIKDADSEFPALYQLFNGYFHEDWRDEHGSVDAALAAFRDEAPRAAVEAAAAETSQLLSLGLDDIALQRVLSEGLGCSLVVSGGETPTQWLGTMREKLQAS